MKPRTKELFQVIFSELKIASEIPTEAVDLYWEVASATHVIPVIRAELLGIIHSLEKKPDRVIQQNLLTFYLERL
ncbi:MAG: hypothetical protein AAFR61_15195 [Bacteroidota bacterium]